MNKKIKVFYIFYLSSGYKLMIGCNKINFHCSSKYTFSKRSKKGYDYYYYRENKEINQSFKIKNSQNFSVIYNKALPKKLTILQRRIKK